MIRRTHRKKKQTTAARDTKSLAVVPVSGKKLINKSGNQRGMHMKRNPPKSSRMSKIRAMRSFYGKQMPAMRCDSCAVSSSCPKFRTGYECAYLPFLNSHSIKNMTDLVHGMKQLATASIRRAHFSAMIEQMTGERPSTEVTEQLMLAAKQMNDLYMALSKNDLTLELQGDGQSIVAKIFGSLDSFTQQIDKVRKDPIDVTQYELENARRSSNVIEAEVVSDSGAEVETEALQEFRKKALEREDQKLGVK